METSETDISTTNDTCLMNGSPALSDILDKPYKSDPDNGQQVAGDHDNSATRDCGAVVASPRSSSPVDHTAAAGTAVDCAVCPSATVTRAAVTTPPATVPTNGDNLPETTPADVDTDNENEAAALQESGQRDRYQSSTERNIWSVFNPIWNHFTVRKARLPKTSDIEANWAGTAGRPEELKLFLGLKNTTNRK